MPAVLWHEVRCTGAEDLVGTAEGLNFRLSLEKFLRCHSDNVFLQELLLSVLSFLNLSCLFKLPFLFGDEMGHM